MSLLNNDRKRLLDESDLFADQIKISILKQIDKIFEKGLSYYVDPTPLFESKEESIFFRKDNFNAALNLTAKQTVNKFEEEKLEIETLLKLSDVIKERRLPAYKITDNPRDAAFATREKIYPTEKSGDKEFLKKLIANLSEENVLVFEFVESYNKKEKANINGFFLAPDVIVLKWQKYTKREIFTLAHEVAHYLLKEEEIDDKIGFDTLDVNISEIEQWCNEFAFCFLIGRDNYSTLSSLYSGSPANNYHHEIVERIFTQTHVSKLSLYTGLLYANKISRIVYNQISTDIKNSIASWEASEKAKFEKQKLEAEAKGEKLTIPLPKAIISPFYLSTLQLALYNGLVDEFEFCDRLKIKPEKLEAYLA